MNDHRDGNSHGPFPSVAHFNPEAAPADGAGSGSRSPLPAGWRRLPTGLRGSRLYHISRPGDTVTYWEAEIPLDSGRVHRRFASEIHARAWLRLAAEPRGPAHAVEAEETHGAFRFVPGLGREI